MIAYEPTKGGARRPAPRPSWQVRSRATRRVLARIHAAEEGPALQRHTVELEPEAVASGVVTSTAARYDAGYWSRIAAKERLYR